MIVAFLVACRPEPDPLPALTDTGWFGPETTLGCDAVALERIPPDGTTDWYVRDDLEIVVSADDVGAYTSVLVDPDGRAVPLEWTWWTPESLRASLHVPGGLKPSTTYRWTVDDCGPAVVSSFTTSALGAPLVGGPEALVGRSWRLDLAGATWLEPGALGAVLSLYATTPLLVGVEVANAANLDLLGAPGVLDVQAGIVQDPEAATWDFPSTSFVEAPTFATIVDQATLEFGGAPVPVSDFALSGTFSSDGTTIGAVEISGLADTRYSADLVGGGGEDAFCMVAAGVGLSCSPCGDGAPLCLQLHAVDVIGVELPGVVLEAR